MMSSSTTSTTKHGERDRFCGKKIKIEFREFMQTQLRYELISFFRPWAGDKPFDE